MDTIVSLLQEAKARFGPRTALVTQKEYRTERWSYRQLWEVSGRVAANVESRGINKGDRVVVLAPNSPYWVAVYFGCLRVGAVLVPLDVRSHAEFVGKVVAQTQAKLALASGATRASVAGLGVPVVVLEDMDSLLEHLLRSS